MRARRPKILKHTPMLDAIPAHGFPQKNLVCANGTRPSDDYNKNRTRNGKPAPFWKGGMNRKSTL